MFDPDLLRNPQIFSKTLFEKMQAIQEGIADLELYEFRYGLNELIPAQGWDSISLDPIDVIEQRVGSRGFYDRIQIKPTMGKRIILDPECTRLTQMLSVGLVVESYSPEWIRSHFYFDIRGFYFLHRTTYFTEKVLAHFGGEPLARFEPKQRSFEKMQDVGYKSFREANVEVDSFFIHSVLKLIEARGTPVLVAIAGPTAAGKTEIAERLRSAMEIAGKNVTSVELDNFLTDRDDREQRGIHSEGKEALHFDLLKKALGDLISGKVISIPRYDFVYATSSHNLNGNLKPDGVPIVINPADIIFMEGNFPFLLEEIAPLIGIKIVYLTDDPIRLKRKWKRDVDYRKKYELNYFRNRYFKDQFIMAQVAYLPQMETCDITVDTTGAEIWVTPEIREILSK
jgi:uridine kinase